MDETLKPYRQCVRAAKSANSIMRAIKASFINITPTLFDNLYGTPSLGILLPSLTPWLSKDIKLLEDVHRRSTKLVNGLQDIEYEERAQLINLDIDIGLYNSPLLPGGRSVAGLLSNGWHLQPKSSKYVE